MTVLTPDSATSELHAHAGRLIADGRTPDEVLERLPARRGEDADAALWLYSWALAQQLDERPTPRIELPPVVE